MTAVTSTEMVPLADLKPYPANPRNGDIEAIADSLRLHKQYRALVVNKRTMEVLAGNHTMHALHEIGATEALVHYVDVDEEEAARIVLVDNSSNDKAKYDDGLLADLLQSLPDLGGTGYNDDALTELLQKLDRVEPIQGDPDHVPEPPNEAVTKPGDLWLLGEHRLLCGNGLSRGDMNILLDDQVIDLVLTDPPYGVGIKYGDVSPNDTPELVQRIADELVPRLCEIAPVVLITPGNRSHLAYPKPAWTLAWVEKAGVGMGPWGFCCWQPILAYGADPYLKNRLGARPDAFVGDGEGASAKDHPVAKPMRIWSWLLNRGSTEVGERVLDPFGGAGTTLIAAHQEGRIAYLMEIDPTYCDVICKRFQMATGIIPKRGGIEVDFLSEAAQPSAV